MHVAKTWFVESQALPVSEPQAASPASKGLSLWHLQCDKPGDKAHGICCEDAALSSICWREAALDLCSVTSARTFEFYAFNSFYVAGRTIHIFSCSLFYIVS
jgi:hypothetical protein